jgi:hypothetical protein
MMTLGPQAHVRVASTPASSQESPLVWDSVVGRHGHRSRRRPAPPRGMRTIAPMNGSCAYPLGKTTCQHDRPPLAVGDFVLYLDRAGHAHKLVFIWLGPARVREAKPAWVYLIKHVGTGELVGEFPVQFNVKHQTRGQVQWEPDHPLSILPDTCGLCAFANSLAHGGPFG